MNEWMPHGHCFLWDTNILVGRALSDALIAGSYFCIPVALIIFSRRRPDIRFGVFFWLFAFFITSCGLTHVMDIVTIWAPLYAADVLVRMITAAVSLFTAVALFVVLPRVVRWRVEELRR